MGRTHTDSRLSKAHIRHLHERKSTSEKRKRELIRYLENLKEKYRREELTYARYVEIIHQKRNKRTIEEWIHYYHLEALECHRRIQRHRNSKTKKRHLILIISSIVLIILISLIFKNITQTGLVSEGNVSSFNVKSFSQDIDLEFNQTSILEWSPENQGQLNSLKLSGFIKGEGEVQIYLGELLVLDSSKIKKTRSRSITALASLAIDPEEDSSPSQDSEDSEDSQEDSPPEEEPSEENQTEIEEIIEEINETILDLNETEEEDSQDEDLSPSQENLSSSEIKQFIELCEETCNLKHLNLTNESYTLRIEISNAKIQIDKINYEIISEKIEEEVNKTEIIETPETNATITTKQFQAIINKPVKWQKKIELDKKASVKIKIPKDAENITAYKLIESGQRDIASSKEKISITGMAISSTEGKGIITRFWKFLKKALASMTGRAVESEEIEITLDDNATDYEVEYYTEAPQAYEENISNGKRITITGPDNLQYQDVLAFTELDNEVTPGTIKLYHIVNDSRQQANFTVYDNNENGLIDYIEWLVPHLSNQTYEIIIEIIKAEHLDSNKTFIEDIYDLVKAQDNNWTNSIPVGNYIRVTFEQNLTNENDITVYARSNTSSTIGIYEKDSNESIAIIPNITSEDYYKVYLTNLIGEQDVFDLKIIGNPIEFDYIIDPSTEVFYDGFEADDFATVWTSDVSYSRETGTVQDTGSWSINSLGGVTNALMTITNGQDISSYNSCNLTSRLYIEPVYDANEHICMDYSIDGGSNWNRDTGSDGGVGGLCQDGNVDTENSFRTVTYEVTDTTGITSFKYRFRTTASAASEEAYVDNVNLTCYTLPDNAPTANLVSPANNTTSSLTYANFTCNATDDIQLSNITFYWNYSGTWANNGTQTKTGTQNQSIFERLNLGEGTINWNCLACDNASQCSFANENYTYTITILNQPPTDPSSSINSTDGTNFTKSDLNCFSTITDPDSDDLNVTVKWYKNNTLNLTIDYNDSYSSGIFFNSILKSGNLSTGDTWHCGMRLYDGQNHSNWVNSSNITIIPNITTIFFDDFEDNDLDEWNLTTTGTANNWTVELTDPYEGNDHAESNPQDSGEFSRMQINISTYGYQNITFSYYRKLIGLDLTDGFSVRWYNGTSWIDVETDSDGTDTNYVYQTFNLTTNADDNTYFQIQFECTAGAVSEYCRIDNVEVNGTQIERDNLPLSYLINPQDSYTNITASPALINFTCSATDDYNLTNISLYLTNSTNQSFSLNQTENITGLSNSSTWLINLTNGNYTWNCLSCDNASQCAFASLNRSIKVDYDATKPQLTLISPPYNYVSDVKDINFTCNATDDIQLTNMTFYWNYSGTWTSNGTQTITGTQNQSIFQRTNMSNGNYIWTCLACDNASQCQSAPKNYILIVDIPPNMVNLFFDGFEDGDLDKWNLTTTGGAGNWTISTTDPFEENEYVEAKNTGAGDASIMEINISTKNYNNITFSYYRKLIGLDILDGFTSSWYNGTDWIILENDVDGTDTNYIHQNFTLPSDAWDNPNFKIKFECTAGAVSEYCRVDSVKVRGYNEAPQITYVSPIPNTNPIEAGSTSVTFYATMYDFNGVEDLNDNSILSNFTRLSQATRENLSCVHMNDIDANSANYSCTIDMWYFDEAGNWNITIYGKDTEGRSAINDSTYFQYNLLQAMVIHPNNINFTASSGVINETANNDPTIINNTGNYNMTNKIAINAINLLGETNPSESIPAANFSVGLSTGGDVECTGTTLQNATDINITGIILEAGNLSAGQAQEELYYCIKEVPSISTQTYSTQGAGSWLIKVILSMVLVLRKRKKKKKRKILLDDLSIPITVFTNKLGGLEGLVKYLKENLGLTYHEIAELLNRDDRTIWTAYNKSIKKQPTKLIVRKTLVFIPISILKNRKLTILEALVVYLKDKEIKYVEIGKLLNRDQRNIWTIHSRAIKK